MAFRSEGLPENGSAELENREGSGDHEQREERNGEEETAGEHSPGRLLVVRR